METKTNRGVDKRFVIYMLVYVAYTSIYISRVNMSVASSPLENLGVFDAAGYGLVGGLFSTIYATGRLVNGAISDKTPPWVMLSVGLGISGLANLLIGFIPPYIGLLFLWSVNAYAQSMLWSSVLSVVAAMYDGASMKRMTSLMVTAVAMGNVISILLNGWLITAFGISFAFLVPGILNIALGGLIILFTRGISPTQSATGGERKEHLSLFGLLKNRDILLMCIPSVFHGVMKENVSVWMVTFAIATFGVDLSTSSYYVLLIPLIGLIGRLAYPMALSAVKEKENTVSLIGFLLCAIASVLLLFPSLGITAAVIALGLVYAASSMINTSITSIYPTSFLNSGNVASVSGLLDFASYLGAGVSGVVYGVVIEYFGYQPMFISWIAISAISLGVILLINRLRAKEARSNAA